MPSGVIRLRNSKKNQPNPRVMTMGHHERGKAGNTGLDNGQMDPSTDGRTWPDKRFKETGYPKAAENMTRDNEGPPAPNYNHRKRANKS